MFVKQLAHCRQDGDEMQYSIAIRDIRSLATRTVDWYEYCLKLTIRVSGKWKLAAIPGSVCTILKNNKLSNLFSTRLQLLYSTFQRFCNKEGSSILPDVGG